jgi:D-arabinose 1-dehydrogenase-like Zn-dependent alcohol dehydrogenase
MKALGYAAHAARTPLIPLAFDRREPRASDVVIEILYCGVCHSDLHQVSPRWPSFSLACGHGRASRCGGAATVAVHTVTARHAMWKSFVERMQEYPCAVRRPAAGSR